MKKSTFLVGLLALALAGYAFAQEHPEHPKQGRAEGKAEEATIVGENFCLGCSLKTEKGAAAQCSVYGHRHALKVTSATSAGKALPEMNGWILHYLETDNGQPLIKEHHGETVTLKGKVYGAERVLEVSALVEGTKKPEHPEHPKK
jgi:hypothetical protein